MAWSAGPDLPDPPVLGDAASIAALGAVLRRAAADVGAAVRSVIQGLDDPDPAPGSGARLNRQQRARVRDLHRRSTAVTASLDRVGQRLIDHAGDLAEAVGLAQRIIERSTAAGLSVDGPRIERVGGVHGIADPAGEAARDDALARLQRVLDTVLLDLDTRRRSLREDLAKERIEVSDPLT